MTPKAARARLSLYRPNGADRAERDVQRASEDVRGDPALEESFRKQVEFDEVVASVVGRLEPSAGVREKLERVAAQGPKKRRFLFADPAMLAVAVGFLGIVFLVVWTLMEREDAFEGREKVIEIAKVGGQGRIDQFEPVDSVVSSMGDWFALQGFGGFRVPEGFGEFELVGVRMLGFEGQSIACLAIPANQMLFYVFDSRSLSINPGRAGNWKIIELEDGRVIGVEEENGVTFMVVMEGEPDDMKRLIARVSG